MRARARARARLPRPLQSGSGGTRPGSRVSAPGEEGGGRISADSPSPMVGNAAFVPRLPTTGEGEAAVMCRRSGRGSSPYLQPAASFPCRSAGSGWPRLQGGGRLPPPCAPPPSLQKWPERSRGTGAAIGEGSSRLEVRAASPAAPPAWLRLAPATSAGRGGARWRQAPPSLQTWPPGAEPAERQGKQPFSSGRSGLLPRWLRRLGWAPATSAGRGAPSSTLRPPSPQTWAEHRSRAKPAPPPC